MQKKMVQMVLFISMVSLFSFSEEKPHFIMFTLNGKVVSFEGICDLNHEFYKKNYPDYHTDESIRKANESYPNRLCSRITNLSFTSMVELSVTYPDHKMLSGEDFQELAGKTIYALSEKNDNYDPYTESVSDKYAGFYYLSGADEFTIDDGKINFEKMGADSDTTALGSGSFDFKIRRYGESKTYPVQGKFTLQFYIGL